MSKPSKRVNFLDAGRAILLLLGIPFHVSEMYRISGGFLVDSPDRSFVASLLSAFIHSFRMPAFFLLSGYFSVMIIERRGAKAWFRSRLAKLGIPLLGTAVTLGVAERTLIHHFGAGIPLAESFAITLTAPNSWVNHRWFLVVLLMYCATLSLFYRQLERVPQAEAFLQRTRIRFGYFSILFNAALLLVPFAAIVAGKIVGEWILQLPALKAYAIAYVSYAVFFFTGAALHKAVDGLQRFTSPNRSDWVLGFVFLCLYITTYFAFYEIHPGPAVQIVHLACETITGFFATKLFFAFAKRVFIRESQLIHYFVDGSFVIYLLHEVLFLAGGGLLLARPWAPLLEMGLLVTTTLGGAVLGYEVAKRVPTLPLLLNGGAFKRTRHQDDRAPAEVAVQKASSS